MHVCVYGSMDVCACAYNVCMYVCMHVRMVNNSNSQVRIILNTKGKKTKQNKTKKKTTRKNENLCKSQNTPFITSTITSQQTDVFYFPGETKKILLSSFI